MLNQEFNVKNLLYLTTIKDIIKFKLGKKREDYQKNLEAAVETINSDHFSFQDLGKIETDKRSIFVCNKTESHYALKKISDNLVRLYRVKFSNRFDISSQVLTLLKETSDFYIIRTDIKSFYESVERERLIKSINDKRLLSYKCRKLLTVLFNHKSLTSEKGLPPGLSISAPLSEIYLEDFDRQIRSIPQVYFYARYVDDLIIFCSSNHEQVIKTINEKLSEVNLNINKKKTSFRHFKNCNSNIENLADSFEFLGYKYSESKTPAGQERSISISLSEKRIRRIKTRIVLAILDYKKNSDYELLLDRIKFLTSNFSLFKNNESSNLKAGIYYSYILINQYDQLKSLDNFLRKLINTKKGPGSALAILHATRKGKLTANSFLIGHRFRKEFIFDKNKFSKIVKCWKNEN
ncbi:antiviral reverse transcriptase Drt3a [Vogesella sp. AC12]|uniref:antiviral reverse transcriptase Drt3a n=1 Tax=Vogesella sp. AC12 TaxID=2950550 RepID=UPI00210A958C|nr:antiviral reverse transcriptase Drt3a [Vogesella sp. AC12]MCQ4143198.1 reverse transcriptase domain-containing protein [Vogesella sp. AC12]